MYRLFFLSNAKDAVYDFCLRNLEKVGPQISEAKIVRSHDFLPRHISFTSHFLTDEGVNQLISVDITTTPGKSTKICPKRGLSSNGNKNIQNIFCKVRIRSKLGKEDK